MKKRPIARSGPRRTFLSPAVWWIDGPPGEATRFARGEIVCADAFDFLTSLQDNSADIVFIDPPFNLGKSYGRRGPDGDRLHEVEYLRFMTGILERSIQVLKPGGALFLYHVPRWASTFAEVLSKELVFRHWIAISMKNGFVRRERLYPAHYALVYFTKGKPAHFARPKIAPPRCPHCGQFIRDYGGYEEHIRNGINLSDIWDDVSPVRHKKYKKRKANELPMIIPRRAIEIAGHRNGLFVDPFAGSGSALIMARTKGMRFVGCDRERSNCKLIVTRFEELLERQKKARKK
jgi:site-specific DNA-methyltransferase (adenine-specific)